MIRRLLFIALMLSMPFAGIGQTTTGHHKHKHGRHSEHALPTWAKAHHYDASSHVYFPDFYSFYDAARGGYVFWENGAWTFSPAVPPYMEKVDLGKARIQILKGLSLDLHPELNYPNYMKLYPATHEYNDVPVPTVQNQ